MSITTESTPISVVVDVPSNATESGRRGHAAVVSGFELGGIELDWLQNRVDAILDVLEDGRVETEPSDKERTMIMDTDEIQTLRGKGPRNGQYVGAVAICQALRRLGCSYSQISSIVGSSERTVWNHVHAMTGSNVAPWGRRTLEARSRAMQVAAVLVRECHMTPRGTTC